MTERPASRLQDFARFELLKLAGMIAHCSKAGEEPSIAKEVRLWGAENDAAGLAGGEGDILVFEDAKPGVQAGKAAGMKVVWVPDPNLRALLSKENEDLNADQILESLEDFEPEAWGLPPF
ncbi:Predicted haloacid-halidohydrolase and related hydrolases [Ceraceosorus bombacis]|uniref:Predicted haloacid-halidohydrolase and related hydrolases n=1 Tax=Ceraceosorus bombacis TaxID=401625 RepID=A0A0P1BNV6_9BASI|nr:Predicted haloacid-halidohydrolase and related hydrolases [Ceraceosorus bombacis]